MKPFTFEEYKRNPKRKVVTRENKTVIDIKEFNTPRHDLITGRIHEEGFVEIWNLEGKTNGSKTESPNDIFFAN